MVIDVNDNVVAVLGLDTAADNVASVWLAGVVPVKALGIPVPLSE